MAKFEIKELTKDNEKKYLEQVVELENKVVAGMNKEGKAGQLFPTGKEGIAEYVNTDENTVIIAVDEKEKVESAAYITQGQLPFTYNDLTKYFKYGSAYQDYVQSKYPNKQEYQKDMLDVYKIKLEAFKYAKEKILTQFPQYGDSFMNFLNHELEEDQNHFHEKSQLRELMNKYMSEYVANLDHENLGIKNKYENFYWITSDEISKEFNKKISTKNASDKSEYESFMQEEKSEAEYREALKKGQLQIFEDPKFNISKYFNSNTSNAIEIDTYLTDPDNRDAGLAKVTVFEGIKKHIERFFTDDKNNEMFLCSTLHRDNLSSKYVSEFFGLEDSLYVKRRDGRNREVHICKISKNEYQQYLENMQKKLAVLYNYNPQAINITAQEKRKVLEDQILYDEKEIKRLMIKISKDRKKYKVNKHDLEYKRCKIARMNKLNAMLTEVEREEKAEREDR